MPDFKIYPRGFYGSPLSARVALTPGLVENNFGFHQYITKSVRSANSPQDANEAIEQLYWAYINHRADCLSFEFKAKVFKLGLHAFGTQNFYEWFCKQLTSPVCGDLHGRFLQDILHFISEGKRDLPLENWSDLLGFKDGGGIENKISVYALDFFGASAQGITRHAKNRALPEVFAAWCAQPNGFEDLLGTLRILFGKAQA
jgi:hypothetical protein